MRWEDPHTRIVVADIGPPFGPVRELRSPGTQDALQNASQPDAVEAEVPSLEDGQTYIQLSPTQPHTSHSLAWS